MSDRPRVVWLWRWARHSPSNILALLGAATDTDPAYRSPHSSAGNITLCDGIPYESCVSGGWWKRGVCCLEEGFAPVLTAAESATRTECAGCSLRRVGKPALSPQMSRAPYSPPIPVPLGPDEPAMRDWLQAEVLRAATDAPKRVARAALAISQEATCNAPDMYALGEWLSARLEEERPWHATTDGATSSTTS